MADTKTDDEKQPEQDASGRYVREARTGGPRVLYPPPPNRVFTAGD